MKLVEPFVNQHDPVQFGLSDKDHYHGQSANWLRRLVPLLKSRCHEARILAAFHFVVEASIRKRQEKLQVSNTQQRYASGQDACFWSRVTMLMYVIKPPLATARAASCDGRVHLFVCSSVRLSPNCKKAIFSKTKQFRQSHCVY